MTKKRAAIAISYILLTILSNIGFVPTVSAISQPNNSHAVVIMQVLVVHSYSSGKPSIDTYAFDFNLSVRVIEVQSFKQGASSEPSGLNREARLQVHGTTVLYQPNMTNDTVTINDVTLREGSIIKTEIWHMSDGSWHMNDFELIDNTVQIFWYANENYIIVLLVVVVVISVAWIGRYLWLRRKNKKNKE